MCYEWYMRRRRQETEQSREIWQDFESTTPISDPAPPDITEPDVTEPERAEQATASER
jgi:hypothetical protein